MADNIAHIRSAKGSFLMSIDFYRQPNGDITAALRDMPTHVIESETTIAARFTKAAIWCVEGAMDLMRQAVRFDEETRAAQNENPASAIEARSDETRSGSAEGESAASEAGDAQPSGFCGS